MDEPGRRAGADSKCTGPAVQARIQLAELDVVRTDWPQGFDLVILGGNCFYELATPQEQAHCIAAAAAALIPGGFVYVDNNHMEGPLAESWQQPGIWPCFPSGLCADGTRLASSTETIWFAVAARLVRLRRTTTVTRPDGQTHSQTCMQQKHPVSCGEVQAWLQQYGFAIKQLYSDRAGNLFTPTAARAIFWARQTVLPHHRALARKGSG